MILRPKDRKNIIMTGIFISFLLTITGIFIFMLGSEDSIFTRKTILKTRVSNAQNLKVGAAVQLKGIKIGTIHAIEFAELDSIIISLGITQKYLPYIKVDSYISVRTQGVLGDKFLEILGGSNDKPVPGEGAFIETQEIGSFDKILSKGEDILQITNRVLSKMDVLLSGVGQDNITAIMQDMRTSMKETKDVLLELKNSNYAQTFKNVNQASKNLENMSQSLAAIGKQIQTGPGTMHSLIYDRGVYDDLVSLLDGSKRNKVLKYFIRETIKKSEK